MSRTRGAALVGVTLAGVTLLATACAATAHHDSARTAAAAAYLRLADPANDVLDHAFDALAEHDKDDLAAAQADLRAVVRVEHAFDRDLRTIALTPAQRSVATHLIEVNEARAALTSYAASVTSLSALHALEPELTAMNGPVERDVHTLRRQLRLPPPDTD